MINRLLKISGRRNFPLLWQQALKLENPCRACARLCGIQRNSGELGFCGVGNRPLVTKFFITHGEEEIITPSRMLYAAGCNLRCAYCSNAEFIDPGFRDGMIFDPAALAAEIDDDFVSGRIRALQLLGGEATCYLSAAVELVSLLHSAVPVVWNSNFFFSDPAYEIIREITDFYIADFKFGNDRCASKLAAVSDYTAVIKKNIRMVDPDRLIVRQLPLHGHLDCCTRPILEYLARELPEIAVNFNELLPDRDGRCRRLDEAEQLQLDEMVREFGIRRIRSVMNPNFTNTEPGYFSGEILLRPDGTIAVQDLAQPILELISELGISERKIR